MKNSGLKSHKILILIYRERNNNIKDCIGGYFGIIHCIGLNMKLLCKRDKIMENKNE